MNKNEIGMKRGNNMIDQQKRYRIDNYGKKSTFSNFLPGISGEMGIPLWCFYVNRGQAVSSFGIQDKDHSIMQFYPAHQSYQNTKRAGFRTFLKVDGKVWEPFHNEDIPHQMWIGMNELEIKEINQEAGYEITVTYFTLPEESVAGLVRKVTIKNLSAKQQKIEVLDGMAAILPYGINLSTMNEMGQTAKAWMQVENLESDCPIFKVRASMEDSAVVTEVKGGNYGFAYNQNGTPLKAIVGYESIFAYDTALETPHLFLDQTVDQLLSQKQKTQNQVPCCFFAEQFQLEVQENYHFVELFGQAEDVTILEAVREKLKVQGYIEEKLRTARNIVEKLTSKIAGKTGNELFDQYSRQTYLDNVMRGGEPTILGENKIFYLYARKHGDMERDYNYFRVLPEYYSQGNGNFRDVNQNRRVDIRFSPYVGLENIKLFYNALQIDGYNPLGIEKITYTLGKEKAKQYQGLEEFLTGTFTPGSLMKELIRQNAKDLFHSIMKDAIGQGKTDFIEGYWSDHWTYNLDLVEEFEGIFPDKKRELLFTDKSYTYSIGKEFVLPSRKRYEETPQGIRQYHFLEKNPSFQPDSVLTDKNGNVMKQSLIEKMITLALLKFTALDSYGMGVEMEGGKPGWYDALNGLPGLLGSSMAETYELLRLLEYLICALEKESVEIVLLHEVAQLLQQTVTLLKKHPGNRGEVQPELALWKELNLAKEAYREKVKLQVQGTVVTYSVQEMNENLKQLKNKVKLGVEKALTVGNGLCPTYFYYEVTDYKKTKDGIEILNIIQKTVPLFLEGAVRYFKTETTGEEKKRLYQAVRQSSLYDDKLKMYKVNSKLSEATYEIGRAKAFTPGWLENESIWLHMEYKYLLELLKSDLKKEFLEELKATLICFQKEEVYGRSLLENSSFIASSANPDESIHGKGFVARLSGSTVEFIHMWQIMMFGEKPFAYEHHNLTCGFQPTLPSYLIGESKVIEATFLGNIKVIYHLPDQMDFIPGEYGVTKYELTMDNQKTSIQDSVLQDVWAHKVRDGKVQEIQVFVERIHS